MFSLEHCIVFMVHLIVFMEHSIFFLEHSNFFWSICQIEDTKKIIECSQKNGPQRCQYPGCWYIYWSIWRLAGGGNLAAKIGVLAMWWNVYEPRTITSKIFAILLSILKAENSLNKDHQSMQPKKWIIHSLFCAILWFLNLKRNIKKSNLILVIQILCIIINS